MKNHLSGPNCTYKELFMCVEKKSGKLSSLLTTTSPNNEKKNGNPLLRMNGFVHKFRCSHRVCVRPNVYAVHVC